MKHKSEKFDIATWRPFIPFKSAWWLVFGLLASAALHVVLVFGLSHFGTGAGSSPAMQPMQPMRVSLHASLHASLPPQVPARVLAKSPTAVPIPQARARTARPEPARDRVVAVQAATPEVGAALTGRAGAPAPVAPVPWFPSLGLMEEPDLTYYSAREVDVRAVPLSDVQPTLPASQFDAATPDAHLILRILINEQGTVDKVVVEQSDPPGLLDAAAIAAFSSVSFRPAMKAGRAVRSQKLIMFTLGNPKAMLLPPMTNPSASGEPALSVPAPAPLPVVPTRPHPHT